MQEGKAVLFPLKTTLLTVRRSQPLGQDEEIPETNHCHLCWCGRKHPMESNFTGCCDHILLRGKAMVSSPLRHVTFLVKGLPLS